MAAFVAHCLNVSLKTELFSFPFTILSASQTLIFITVCDVEGCYYPCFEGKQTLISNSAICLLSPASI